MSKQTTTFSANGTTQLDVSNFGRDSDAYIATCFIGGTFGGGTMAIFLSPDNGFSLFPALDSSGSAITATTTKSFNLTLGGGVSIIGVLSGATSPTITVTVANNRV